MGVCALDLRDVMTLGGRVLRLVRRVDLGRVRVDKPDMFDAPTGYGLMLEEEEVVVVVVECPFDHVLPCLPKSQKDPNSALDFTFLQQRSGYQPCELPRELSCLLLQRHLQARSVATHQ